MRAAIYERVGNPDQVAVQNQTEVLTGGPVCKNGCRVLGQILLVNNRKMIIIIIRLEYNLNWLEDILCL